MLDLLQVPFKKLSGYRGFWIFLGMALTLTYLGVWTIARFDLTGMGAPELNTQRFFTFPDIWTLAPWLLKLAGYFLSSIMILLVCHDLENGLLRQHVIDGWSRERLLASYSTLSIVFVIVSVALLLTVGIAFGVKGSGSYFDRKAFDAIFGFALQNFLTFQFALMLSLLFKRAVMCVVAFLSWQLICEPILGSVLNAMKLKSFAEHLPFTVIDKLMPSLRSLLPENFSALPAVSSGLELTVVFMSLAYLLVFYALSWLALSRDDL